MKDLMQILLEIRPDIDFDVEEKLVTDNVLDSMDIVTLVAMIEENYGIEVLPTDLTKENFDSVESIMALIKFKDNGIK